MATSETSSGGLGFASVLTLIFIVLKLTDVIAWSWLWVLSPLWISALLGFSILLIVLLVALVAKR